MLRYHNLYREGYHPDGAGMVAGRVVGVWRLRGGSKDLQAGLLVVDAFAAINVQRRCWLGG